MGECRFQSEVRRLLKESGEYLCMKNGRELWRVNGRLFTLPAHDRVSPRVWKNTLSQIRRAVSGVETKPGRVTDDRRCAPERSRVVSVQTRTIGDVTSVSEARVVEANVSTQVQSLNAGNVGPQSPSAVAQPPAAVKGDPVSTAQAMVDQALALATAAEGWRERVKGLVEAYNSERRLKEAAQEKARDFEKRASIREAEFAKFNGRDFPKELERAEAKRLALEAENADLKKKVAHLQEKVAHLQSAFNAMTKANEIDV